MHEYAKDVDDKLRQAELASINDYIQESDNLVELHNQVRRCLPSHAVTVAAK